MTLLRIPVLVGLLLASGSLQSDYAVARLLLTLDGAVGALPQWLALVGVAVAFVLVAAFGRDRKHPTPVLILEVLVAFVIAVVPPLIWMQVAPGPWNEAMGGNSGMSFAQVLAVVWAMIAVRTFRTRARDGVAEQVAG